MNYICVAGFLYSGSSAVVDLLKEYKGIRNVGTEFRIIKDPYGISELEWALTDHWELVNSSAAIWDFIDLCKICARKGGTGGKHPLARAGLCYTEKINPEFMKLTYEYISRITDFTYNDDYYFSKFKKSYYKFVADRIRYAIEIKTNGRIKTANRKLRPQYFSYPSKEKFYAETKRYLTHLFQPFEKRGAEYLILDQAVSPNDIMAMRNYLPGARMIVIDRDIRDMYVEYFAGNGFVYDKYWQKNLERYIYQQKVLRKDMDHDSNDVLRLRFEDLVLHYNETVKCITDFLGLNEEDHKFPKRYFNPDISIRNVRKWKNMKGMEKIASFLEEAAPEYCYDS